MTDTALERAVREVLDIPLHRWLGMELAAPPDPTAGIRFPVAPHAVNNTGMLHGALLLGLLDVACYLRLLPELDPAVEAAVTHNAFSSLLRPAGPEAVVEVTASVVRRGRTLAFLDAAATADGVLVATGSVTKSIVPRR